MIASRPARSVAVSSDDGSTRRCAYMSEAPGASRLTVGSSSMLEGAMGCPKRCRLGLVPERPAVIREYPCGDDKSLGLQALLKESIGSRQCCAEWFETLHKEKTECLGRIVALTIESAGDVKIRPVGMICRRITGDAMRDEGSVARPPLYRGGIGSATPRMAGWAMGETGSASTFRCHPHRPEAGTSPRSRTGERPRRPRSLRRPKRP
jgi:hypothetical protein